jgi:putative membrane protein
VIPIAASITLVCVTVLYLLGWLRLRAAFPGLVSRVRVAAFLAGMLFAWVAVGSPLAALDHYLLSIHMIQHLLLMSVAAPLILLGKPDSVLLHALPKPFVRGVVNSRFERTWIAGLDRSFSTSVFCWFAGTITVIVWHVPAVFALGHHSVWWHEIEQATFALAGLLFWWPVIREQEPRWSVPLYLFLATLPCDALSAYLVFCEHVVYRPYLAARGILDLSPLEDQQWAGALMWVAVTLIYVVPAVAITVRLLSVADRRTPAIDAGLDHVPETS